MDLKEFIERYKNIIIFVVVLLSAHFVWKILVVGDESDQMVTLFGWNISAPFKLMVYHIARVSDKVINFFGFDVNLLKGNALRFANGNGIRVVWGCTAIKQAYIFFCIMFFSHGSWKNKLWFIPAGLIVIYLFNIFRISLIAIIVKNHPELFILMHKYVLKTIFYIVIFLMWVLWQEKFVANNKKISV